MPTITIGGVPFSTGSCEKLPSQPEVLVSAAVIPTVPNIRIKGFCHGQADTATADVKQTVTALTGEPLSVIACTPRKGKCPFLP